MTDTFQPGEAVLLYDERDRQYLLHLRVDGSFQFHRGSLPHTDIIGQENGCTVTSSGGARLIALRPRLADFVLKMRRGAQVVYPKDAGAILIYADIGPGMTVVEAGSGSGALTMVLARAVGSQGTVISVERRPDHADHARKAIERFFGSVPEHVDLRVGEVEEVLAEISPDRLVLDLPEPWHAAPVAAERLRPGGVFCAYLPTVPQLQSLHERLAETGAFHDAESFEVLHRTWNVQGRSVRPSHQMVGHTGFITTARRILPESGPSR